MGKMPVRMAPPMVGSRARVHAGEEEYDTEVAEVVNRNTLRLQRRGIDEGETPPADDTAVLREGVWRVQGKRASFLGFR